MDDLDALGYGCNLEGATNVINVLKEEVRTLRRRQQESGDIERNAKYRAEAVQPMVDELKSIRDDLRTHFLVTQDLLAELIKRSH